MINYKHNKKQYKPNDLGSLYIDENKLNPNEQPIIYIGGQMEHRCHIFEKMGYTFDAGHNMFTGSWFYEYPLSIVNRGQYNAENFSQNLIAAIKEANLHNVILITESYGGTIGSLATSSELIDKVIAIHPSILGTPLANPDSWEPYMGRFTFSQKQILTLLKIIVDSSYGFSQDNFKGADLTKINLDKLLVVGSCIEPEKEKNRLILELDTIIRKITSHRSDGVVIFEPKLLEELGINYIQEDESVNHFIAGTKEHIAKVYQKTIKNIF